MLKSMLRACIEGKTMNATEAEQTMDEIMTGQATPSQIASLLTVLRFRGETVDEVTGFAKSMRRHLVKIEHNYEQLVDTCGTGGDELGTFNISTTAALALAAIGIRVAKHGNRAVSSTSGSADVLEHLGIEIQHSPKAAAQSLANNKLCFLFAPLYHQSMKHAVAPRKEIGFRTIFNMLGPLTNPAKARHQLIGVSDARFAEKMAEALQRLGTEHTLFVTGENGLDECSITGETIVIEVRGDERFRYSLTPEEVGLRRGTLSDIQVNSPRESAALVERVLKGEANASAQSIVAYNAGAALYAADRASSIKEGVVVIQEAITSGQVFEFYQQLKTAEKETEQHA